MPDRELNLVEHLGELRRRIIYCLVTFLFFASISTFLAKPILAFLCFPAKGVITKLAFFSPPEVAIVYIKLTLSIGLIFSLPLILYQVWKFVQPAIEKVKQGHVLHFIFWVLLSFMFGCAFGYFVLLPVSLKFLIGLAGRDLVPVISLNSYLSFALALILGAGLVFQTPILVWLLSKLKLVSAKFLRRKRKYAIVANFILAAMVTPTTDPFTMSILAVPMCILYEISIWVAQWAGN